MVDSFRLHSLLASKLCGSRWMCICLYSSSKVPAALCCAFSGSATPHWASILSIIVSFTSSISHGFAFSLGCVARPRHICSVSCGVFTHRLVAAVQGKIMPVNAETPDVASAMTPSYLALMLLSTALSFLAIAWVKGFLRFLHREKVLSNMPRASGANFLLGHVIPLLQVRVQPPRLRSWLLWHARCGSAQRQMWSARG